jgi:hypothetical protein
LKPLPFGGDAFFECVRVLNVGVAWRGWLLGCFHLIVVTL